MRRRGFLKAAVVFCAAVALQPLTAVLPSRLRTVVERIIIQEPSDRPYGPQNKTVAVSWAVVDGDEYGVYSEISPRLSLFAQSAKDIEDDCISHNRYELETAMFAEGIDDYMLVPG